MAFDLNFFRFHVAFPSSSSLEQIMFRISDQYLRIWESVCVLGKSLTCDPVTYV